MTGNATARRIVAVAIAATSFACGTDKVSAPPTVAAVTVTPGADTIATLGRTRQFTAVANDANGAPVTVTLIWRSTNPAVATVDSVTGIVTAVANGQTTIRADAGGVIGQAAVAVAQLVATVQVTPGTFGLTTVGATKQFSAVAKDSGGATVAGVRFLWLSSDNTVAVVDTLGVAKSKGPGQAIITAAGRGVPGNAVLTVTQAAAHLAFIGVMPGVVAGDTFTAAIQVEIQDSAGAVVTGSHTPVTIEIDSGPPGTLTGTLTAAPSGGVATFINVGFDGADGPHALLATASGVASAVSPPFAVFPGVAVRASWASGGGTNEAVGDTQPPWQYDVFDRFGNLATGSPVTVQLVVGTSQWGSHLRGPTAVFSSGGVATFSGFSLDRPGTDVFLVAAVNGDTGFSGNFTRDTLPALDDMAVGTSHVCAAGATATFCWGSNEDGDLGNFSSLPDSVPVLVESPVQLTSLVVSDNYSCGLTATGAAYCWGMDFNTGIHESVPVPVAGGLTFTKLGAGEIHTCGLTTGGDVYCWGSNFYGQLGDARASGLSSSTPVLAAGGHTFTDLSVSFLSTCAIASGGDAYCWGYGAYGSLGTGSSGDDSVPTLVQGGLKFSQISLGTTGACGVAVDSLAYCWGDNIYGVLGDSTIASDSQPVAVYGGIKFASVGIAGPSFACGRATDSEIWCWGQQGPANYGIAPVDLGISADALFVGYGDACILQSGAPKCWGNNADFMLGDGTSIDEATPHSPVTQSPQMRGRTRPTTGAVRRQ